MSKLVYLVLALATSACNTEGGSGVPSTQGSVAAPAVPQAVVAQAVPAAPSQPDIKTAWTVALGSPDHTTLVAAVKAADLVEVLASPGGVYTVFAPTNAAFDKLPKGTVDDLLKPEKKPDLRKVLQHHVGIPVMATREMKEGGTLQMADGAKVTFHVKDGKVTVEGANILASIPTANGIVYVVDAVLLPASK